MSDGGAEGEICQTPGDPNIDRSCPKVIGYPYYEDTSMRYHVLAETSAW